MNIIMIKMMIMIGLPDVTELERKIIGDETERRNTKSTDQGISWESYR